MKNFDEKNIVVTIDGVAASGKSTTAKLVAESLGFKYLDTGAMYRAAALAAKNSKVNAEDEDTVFSAVETSKLSVECSSAKMKIFIYGEEVSEQLRTDEVSELTSIISRFPSVRNLMVKLQREMVKNENFVVEGRDIGTVVFPNAKFKFFLTASAEVRAKRRYKEMEPNQNNSSIEEVENEIKKRDLRDSTRAISPLKKAEDAVELDTTEMTIDEQVKHLTRVIQMEIQKESQVYAG
ncbi:MAG: (d)CMP kinase [Candidatus Marinimicrobia bacterium]|nr:(d)CMP kinase [Candidatus Neomarinimicrobiota bacterium]